MCIYTCLYIYILYRKRKREMEREEGGTGCIGYHETRVPGVPLAGYVLRPGRTINCEVLPSKGEGRRGRGTLYCYRFTRHAYLTPAFPASPPCRSLRWYTHGRVDRFKAHTSAPIIPAVIWIGKPRAQRRSIFRCRCSKSERWLFMPGINPDI